jgi:RNA polymerase sigma-70 factor (ECF subfamily)
MVDSLRELAQDAQAGDREATRRLLAAVAPAVHRVAVVVLGPARADAEDVAQEALLGFIRALGGFRGDCTVLHFARRIAARWAVAARRRRRERDAQAAEYWQASQVVTDRLPGEPLVAARRRELVRRLLDELPEAQAETVALRFILDCSLQETAEATGVPVNTVRSRIRVAKESLRRRLEEDPELREMLEVAG